MRRGLRVLVLATPVLSAIAAVAIAVVGRVGNLPDDDFHSAAAQIIPVLLLALVVEGRTAEIWGSRRARLYRVQIVTFLLVGELSAILETGDILGQDEVSAALTGAGLVGGFVAVALVAVVPTAWLGSDDLADRS